MVANIFCDVRLHRKHDFSYLKLENSCLILGSALPRLQLCYGHSTYLPLRHTFEIRFYRPMEASRVNAQFPEADPEEIIRRPNLPPSVPRSTPLLGLPPFLTASAPTP